MLPELGHYSLILALLMACMQMLLPSLGVYRNKLAWQVISQHAVRAQCLFLLFSYSCLSYAFYCNDFSVAYVANNSFSQLPVYYRLTAVWGAHEGSMLLWATLLALWSLWFARVAKKQLSADIYNLSLAILGAVSVGFILFLLLTSNPFARILVDTPMDGRDLNPLLQDFGFIIHPPMLYMGYVGFAVSFAVALAVLLRADSKTQWATWLRKPALLAWMFLTIGIMLGSWWAYRELGWGGWWFWDPVENASLLPWLVGTALIHSLVVTSKRNSFKAWSLLLAIITFGLSLLGTFLVRSGVLTSVHAFVTDPNRGLFMLCLLSLYVGTALLLFAVRVGRFASQPRFSLAARESLLLINNLLLLTMAASVLLGTLYPLFIDVLGLGKLSVGPPYFNLVMAPLCFLLAVALILVPWSRWQLMSMSSLLRTGFIILAIAILFIWLFGHSRSWSSVTLVGVTLGFALLVSNMAYLFQYNKFRATVLKLPMVIAHTGFAISLLGICLTSNFSLNQEVLLKAGESVDLGPYKFQLLEVTQITGPNYDSEQARILVSYLNERDFDFTLLPEKRHYRASQMVMTDADVDAGFWRDVYAALGDARSNGGWAIHLYFKPFVRWIWLGAILMAFAVPISLILKRFKHS